MIDIDNILENLSKERVIFHSEADFQHALAWKLHEEYPDINIRLERRMDLSNNEKIYVDIYLSCEECVVLIELKYKTEEFKYLDEKNNEIFELKKQDAQDNGRYDFIKDISRLEKCVENLQNVVGYAIFLTNDSSYWKLGKRNNTEDKNFRIHEGRKIPKNIELKWKSPENKVRRKNPIKLKNEYELKWKDFSSLENGSYSTFKYLLIKIT